MSQKLENLLIHTWGIACRRRKGEIIGIYKYAIDVKDRVAALTLPKEDGRGNIEVGQWVGILRGPYKGDLGLVAHVEPWSCVLKLLVVPRLKPHFISRDLTTQPKRKRGQGAPQTIPALVNPYDFAATRKLDLREVGPHLYKIGSFTFQHGLLLKAFSSPSVSSTAGRIPSSLATLFIQSGHPKVDADLLPPPWEWEFQVGDRVVCLSEHDGKLGVVQEVSDRELEIELANEAGRLIRVPWKTVLREHSVGSFVQICKGPDQGRTGWVVGIDGHLLSCAVEFISDYDSASNSVEVRKLNSKLKSVD